MPRVPRHEACLFLFSTVPAEPGSRFAVRGYDGSWVEWGNRADLPVVTGAEPGSPAEATR